MVSDTAPEAIFSSRITRPGAPVGSLLVEFHYFRHIKRGFAAISL